MWGVMSTARFRQKALDNSKPLPVYREKDHPDVVSETAALSRSVSDLPTGMEKEEEEVRARTHAHTHTHTASTGQNTNKQNRTLSGFSSCLFWEACHVTHSLFFISCSHRRCM